MYLLHMIASKADYISALADAIDFNGESVPENVASEILQTLDDLGERLGEFHNWGE